MLVLAFGAGLFFDLIEQCSFEAVVCELNENSNCFNSMLPQRSHLRAVFETGQTCKHKQNQAVAEACEVNLKSLKGNA